MSNSTIEVVLVDEQFNHRGSIGGWSNSTIEVVLVDEQFNHRGSIGG